MRKHYGHSTPATEVLNALFEGCKEKKTGLAIFHVSWCGWCHKMTASLNDPAMKPYFDKNYVIEDFVVYESKERNLEKPGVRDPVKKVLQRRQGLPTWLFF